MYINSLAWNRLSDDIKKEIYQEAIAIFNDPNNYCVVDCIFDIADLYKIVFNKCWEYLCLYENLTKDTDKQDYLQLHPDFALYTLILTCLSTTLSKPYQMYNLKTLLLLAVNDFEINKFKYYYYSITKSIEFNKYLAHVTYLKWQHGFIQKLILNSSDFSKDLVNIIIDDIDYFLPRTALLKDIPGISKLYYTLTTSDVDLKILIKDLIYTKFTTKKQDD